MSKNVISVIIPVYNRAKELKKCLAALKKQTFQSFELIIIDDGSTDNVITIIEQFKKDFQTCIFLQQQNKGAAYSRNRGAKIATGKYLFFLDADCILQSNCLHKMLNILKQSPYAFVYCPFYWGWKKMKGVPFNAEKLKHFNYISTMSMLKREYFPGFDEKLTRFQDWDLWLTIVQNGGNGILLNEYLFHCKSKRGGISFWLPSFLYKLPWQKIGWMPKTLKKYFDKQNVIKQKHKLM
jgi:glycosyltransferase involved in cell wall biosynthesis